MSERWPPGPRALPRVLRSFCSLQGDPHPQIMPMRKNPSWLEEVVKYSGFSLSLSFRICEMGTTGISTLIGCCCQVTRNKCKGFVSAPEHWLPLLFIPGQLSRRRSNDRQALCWRQRRVGESLSSQTGF